MPKLFSDLGLSDKLLQAVLAKGFEEPTPIQELIIPAFLQAQHDLIGQAQTGTGKTAAFGLPLLDLIHIDQPFIQGLILAPTRELALQVSQEILSFKQPAGLNLAVIYGGQSYTEQLRRLKQGAHIVVGTPGRVLDLMDKGKLKLDNLRYLILDEADEMLNLGFLEDIERLLTMVNPERRMLLFSATMPQPIIDVSRRFMNKPQTLRTAAVSQAEMNTSQIYYEVNEGDKFEALCRIADIEEDFYAIVFCRTKIESDELSRKLGGRGYSAEALHGDLSQQQRESVLGRFRTRRISILVATDVAARGIDVQDLTHVINYHLPQDRESYIHRIGRTGRAGKSGTAITFITASEFRRFSFIQKNAGAEIKKERIPAVASVISSKKKRIESEIFEKMDNSDLSDIREWAKTLLENHDPESLLSAVLGVAFKDQLNPRAYGEIKDHFAPTRSTGPNIDNGVRLYIAVGRKDGYTVRKVVELIQEKAGTRNHKIQDVELLESGTYVTVPFHEAEFILKAFDSKARKERNTSFSAQQKKRTFNRPARR